MTAQLAAFPDEQRSAVLSGCGRYRYRLSRSWGPAARGHLLFLMLNPSRADADVDDATIRKCRGFARRQGWGGFEVVNLFGLRATDPCELLGVRDPVGPENDEHIESAIARRPLVVCAWGSPSSTQVRKLALQRARDIAYLLSRAEYVYCLGTAADGSPRHPLMLPYSAELSAWRQVP